jgi:hypothetical protein
MRSPARLPRPYWPPGEAVLPAELWGGHIRQPGNLIRPCRYQLIAAEVDVLQVAGVA